MAWGSLLAVISSVPHSLPSQCHPWSSRGCPTNSKWEHFWWFLPSAPGVPFLRAALALYLFSRNRTVFFTQLYLFSRNRKPVTPEILFWDHLPSWVLIRKGIVKIINLFPQQKSHWFAWNMLWDINGNYCTFLEFVFCPIRHSWCIVLLANHS